MKITAFRIYLIWIVCFVLFCIVVIPLKSAGHSGGEQVPMTLFFTAGDIFLLGLFVISIVTTFMFWRWFKKYWYVNVSIMIFTGYLLFSTYIV